MPACVPWGPIGSSVCCEPPFAPIIQTTNPISGVNSASPTLSEATILYLTNGTQPVNAGDKRTFRHTIAGQICSESGIANVGGNTGFGNTWTRNTWLPNAQSTTFACVPDTKGGTKAQVWAYDHAVRTTGYWVAVGQPPGPARDFSYQNNLRIHYGLRPWFNSSNNTWYLVLQGTDCFGATCAPYFGIIDTGVWVARIRPQSTNLRQIFQSGAYTCPNVSISTLAGNPRASFSTGTPTLPGIILDLHWRQHPNTGGSDQSYPFNGGSVKIHTHNMVFDFRNTWLIQVSTTTSESTNNWESFEDICCQWPSWPPSYPWSAS